MSDEQAPRSLLAPDRALEASRRLGVNGDVLPAGKLDLPEVLESATSLDWAWARDFITRRRWREAVTYRKTAPHEYTVRKWDKGVNAHADFDRFVASVRRFGHADTFQDMRYIYWVVDDFKYWTMGWPINETTVMNRAPVHVRGEES